MLPTAESKKTFKWKDKDLKPAKSINAFHKRFILGPLLGRGADGEVYAARSIKRNDYWAAVKKIVLDPSQSTVWTQFDIKCARQERKLLAKIHINIYGVYYDKENGCIYKVYDRYNNAVDQLIHYSKKGFSELQTRYIIKCIATDISALHKQHFIHGDIKASNILFCKSGTHKKEYKDKNSYKLIDYDGAMWNYNKANKISVDFQGTIGWTAPEMQSYVFSNEIDYKIDVWAIGLVALYCITGGSHFFQINEQKRDKFINEKSSEKTRAKIFAKWYNAKFKDRFALKKYLMFLYQKNTISFELFDLLYTGVLVSDPTKRLSIGGVLDHEWFSVELNDKECDDCKSKSTTNEQLDDEDDYYVNDEYKSEEEDKKAVHPDDNSDVTARTDLSVSNISISRESRDPKSEKLLSL